MSCSPRISVLTTLAIGFALGFVADKIVTDFPPKAEAQVPRPSIAGLQLQIDKILDGRLSVARATDADKLGGALANAYQTRADADATFLPRTGGTVGNLTVTGSLNSASFAGDGAALTNVSASKLQGRSIAAGAPVTGQSLKWNGSSWVPAN